MIKCEFQGKPTRMIAGDVCGTRGRMVQLYHCRKFPGQECSRQRTREHRHCVVCPKGPWAKLLDK